MKGPGWLTAVALGGDTGAIMAFSIWLGGRRILGETMRANPATVPGHVELTPSYVGVSFIARFAKGQCVAGNRSGSRGLIMRDGVDPWRTGDLVYLEREINYWTGPIGYQACTAGVQAAQDYAARHGMDRVVVLPAWTCRYSGSLKDAVAQIDLAGLVTDCDGAEIVTMPTEESLERFVYWCKQHVRWE